MVMPAFADNTAPTFDIDELDNAGIVNIFTNYGTNNQYCGENGLYKKVYDKLVTGNNDISKYVYAFDFFPRESGSCSKFDIELSSDKEASFLIIWRFANEVNSYDLKLDASNNYSARLGSGNSQYSNFLSYFSIETLIIPVTEELYTIAYDVSESTDSYENFKNSIGINGICAEDTAITMSACGYTDNNYTNKVAATNAPKTFNYVNSDVAKLSDGRTYASLKDAYAAAEDNDTITLLKDTDFDNSSFYGKKLTFDLNNHKLTMSSTSNYYPENVVKNITFKNGTIDLNGVNVGQGIWGLADGVEMNFENINLVGEVVSAASGVVETQPSYTATVNFTNSNIELSAGNLFANNGRLVNYANATFTNTTVSLANFDGGFAGGSKVVFNNTVATVKDGNHALSRAKLTMNGNSTLTVKNCNEGGIKLDNGSEIILNDTSKISMSGNTDDKDIIYRDGISDEAKQNVKIVVGKNAILDAKIASDVMENATVEGKANAVSVEFEATDDENVYNIVITAPSATQIHEFTSAQLKFAKGNNAIGYEIAEANEKISVNEQGDNEYLFNLKSGANIVGEENKIVIGKVIFEGYSEDSVDFKIDTAYENKVVATKGQNITETFTVDNEKLAVNGEEKGIIDAERV